ncbi:MULTISPECIES: family 43 glycosylhydrolase [unclassified Fibrobacter]|uniref:beta-xylosidase family glycoside hydrolase n=1 Tax=unclassified Fibrobacter TaxID=2634177 RepID=UPI000D6A8FB9|nr:MULTISPECIES: family 43 glycosylhydrolase [unclassified Fibrobacter]PWJ61492.1 beta-xylosidase [Fibrobacter sp. UWR4]PZW67308.1 beta-xylosidase [Fibrobacter sp. UWR1]
MGCFSAFKKVVATTALIGSAFVGSAVAASVSNPWIYSDVPDLCIAKGEGDNYYMVSTTMHYAPGVPIMKSTDLANWRTVNYAYQTLTNSDNMNLNGGKNAYGKGSWASAIRYFKGKWYILTPSYTTNKTHLYITDDIENGPFTEKLLPFYHDPSIFFDDDDKAYVIYGGGQLSIVKLKSDLSGPDGGSTVLVNESLRNQTSGTSSYIVALEGAHMEKVNGEYYLFGISWFGPCRTELVFRSKNLMGGYSGKIFLQNNGVAQGSIFKTEGGKWYGYLFRDSGGIGRIPYLMEVEWKDGWPTVVGGKAPATLNLENEVDPGYGMVTSDDFDGSELPLEWQWNHNPDNSKWALSDGKLKITTGRVDGKLYTAKNTLTQRTYGPKCSGRTLVNGKDMKDGDVAGLVALADSLGFVALEKNGNSFEVVYYEREFKLKSVPINGNEAYFRIDFDFTRDRANFYYSLDEKSWTKIGNELKLPYTLGMFVGYRFGLFNFAKKTAGGTAAFDWFKVGNDYNDEIYLDGAVEPVPQTAHNATQTAWAIPGQIEAEDFDDPGKGKGGPSYSEGDAENHGDSDYREGTGVDLYAKATGVIVGYIQKDEWLEYTINVSKAGDYTLFAAVASDGGSSFKLSLDGEDITEDIAVPAAKKTDSEEQNFDDYSKVKANVVLPAGEHILRFTATADWFDIDYFNFAEGKDAKDPAPIVDPKDPEQGLDPVCPEDDEDCKTGIAKIQMNFGGVQNYRVFDLKGNMLGMIRSNGMDIVKATRQFVKSNGIYIVKPTRGGMLHKITVK